MKKLFTLAALITAVLTAQAADYTDSLEVSVNGVSMTQTATISIEEQSEGTYKMELNNFALQSGGDVMGVGNIVLNNVKGTTENNITTLTFNDSIKITEGTDENIAMWMGPYLGNVPINMTGELRDGKFYTVINIDMSSTLQQVIKVTFGSGYQIPNSGFEFFHTATYAGSSKTTTSDEPNAWHSFQSATNNGLSDNFAAFAKGTAHSFSADEARPGSTGTHSVLITSSAILGVIANGTITTGRINAGSTQAANTANHSYIDMDNSNDKDANGDPFYTQLYGLPDSVAVWVKFKQGTEDKNYPYATISAAITDGTYYQDPEDKTYDNVIASAKNTQIESNGFQWQRISVPFNYLKDDNTSLNGRKAILITISTNATPGKGSKNDSLYVDDIELTYGCELSQISVAGQTTTLENGKYEYDIVFAGDGELTAGNLAFASNSKGMRNANITSFVINDEGAVAIVNTVSGDLKSNHTYTFNIKHVASGIATVEANTANTATSTTYNLAGQPANGRSQVVITKNADNRVVKALK